MSEETDRRIERLRSERNRLKKKLANERETWNAELSHETARLREEARLAHEALLACHVAAVGGRPSRYPEYGDAYRAVVRLRERTGASTSDPIIEIALAQGAAASLERVLFENDQDAYVFADAEGIWFTTFGGPTPGREPILTGGAMLREGMPERVLQRLLRAARNGSGEFGLDLEDPAVVCESCGAFGWGDPVETLGWQAAGTEDDGTLYFCPRCRYEEPAVPEPATEPAAPDTAQRHAFDEARRGYLQTIESLEAEVARLSEALENLARVHTETLDGMAQKFIACEDRAGKSLVDLPEIPTTDPRWSVAYSETMRLRVRYDALVQAYLVPFDREKLDLVEADALRARGMEP